MADELSVRISIPQDLVRKQCCAVVRKLAERRFVQLCR
jgi:hypothetical protein